MNNYLKHDEWCIIEEGFHPEYNAISESVFSLGNGRMGHRANFEESFTGHTLQGNYVAGVYYPDKTRVGWWKNGYPEYFAKVLNSPNWVGLNVEIDGVEIDLAKCRVLTFKRVLNMREGYLERICTLEIGEQKQVQIHSKRFCSLVDDETGAIRYAVKPLNFDASIKFSIFIDADIKNNDSNYDEKFWDEIEKGAGVAKAYIVAQTKKLQFQVCAAMHYDVTIDGEKLSNLNPTLIEKTKYVGNIIDLKANKGQEVVIYKYAAILSSENHPKNLLVEHSEIVLDRVVNKGFDKMLGEQANAWLEKWNHSDIIIEGDTAAQQGIRFCIFQLHQTYTGEDERLNIGPKGFTGEKYGGATYWDTEAYCLPFYLATAEQKVARNLLVYRYKHLDRAIENAAKLGFHSGAALYPMVTMNGEECHNEWEITFEEIHRNGAIAYAIYDYINYTADWAYLSEYGLEVLVGIARFWAQRVNWSVAKNKYVMLGVTGPNEYENNVNNNWYSNYLAVWCLKYTQEAIDYVKKSSPARFQEILTKTQLKEQEERAKWTHIMENMYYPTNEQLGIFLQQEGFMDKEIIPASQLPKTERPLNQKWSWDRILRSCYIKQADVLQGLYFFENDFDFETHRRNFDFYEPLTVHESSLSPCIHSVLASKLGYREKAYEMYLRTARLDLDNYNNDTEDGCHTTSMAGTWLAFVRGFGGMRIQNNQLEINPFLPEHWQAYSFRIGFRNSILRIKVQKNGIYIKNESQQDLVLTIYNTSHHIPAMQTTAIEKVLA